jgi:hypothetical protein
MRRLDARRVVGAGFSAAAPATRTDRIYRKLAGTNAGRTSQCDPKFRSPRLDLRRSRLAAMLRAFQYSIRRGLEPASNPNIGIRPRWASSLDEVEAKPGERGSAPRRHPVMPATRSFEPWVYAPVRSAIPSILTGAAVDRRKDETGRPRFAESGQQACIF